jgi:hypothetical protein
MKIIIDRNNPLEVYDQSGHLLYTYQPIDDADIEGMTLDEQDAFIVDAIRNAYK